MKIRNKAFTLAETLVVMGIIGVIAALTIPNLSQSTGNKEDITRIQKVFSELTEAFSRATAIYGPYPEWSFGSNHTAATIMIGDRITEFMKVSKNCRGDVSCSGYFENGYHFELANGTVIRLSCTDGWCGIDGFPKNKKTVNGKNYIFLQLNPVNPEIMPNYYKSDFSTLLTKAKLCSGLSSSSSQTDKEDCSSASNSWILRYGNMDYLKLNSSGKCPNGNELTESNPRCN